MSDVPIPRGARAQSGHAASRDRSLMERIHAGDSSALDELLRHHWHSLVAYSRRLVASQDAAEDVVQEAMVRMWEQRSQWTPSERLRSFLYQITRNVALDTKRRRRLRNRWVAREAQAIQQSGPTPLETTERAELRDAVRTEIDRLPPRRREVFILARYHGHTYREIAEIMDISPQTVANQMSAAIDRLREALEPRFGDRSSEGSRRVLGITSETRGE